MLYILGGAAKSGKSIIARKITKEYVIPFFCIDFLTSAFHHQPKSEFDHHTPIQKRAEKLWKYTQHIATHIASEEEKYLLEGDAILPHHAAKLQKSHPKKIKACFLGYEKTDPHQKLQKIRKYDHLPDAWTRNFSDKEVLKFIKDRILFSKHLKEECKRHSLPYLEADNNLDEVYKKVTDKFSLT